LIPYCRKGPIGLQAVVRGFIGIPKGVRNRAAWPRPQPDPKEPVPPEIVENDLQAWDGPIMNGRFRVSSGRTRGVSGIGKHIKIWLLYLCQWEADDQGRVWVYPTLRNDFDITDYGPKVCDNDA